ncbi:MAG: MDR family MFS transporter, partial [Anaerolineales bacterium]
MNERIISKQSASNQQNPSGLSEHVFRDYNRVVSQSLFTNQSKIKEYPRQFWVLFVGQLISVSGVSMVWPFMTIYLREQLQLPLATITSLVAIESIMTVISTLLVGPIMDRYGRKRIMVFSLFINSVTFFLLTLAHSFPQFAALSVLRGLFAPLFRVGTNTMVTDLVTEEQRSEAFSWTRTSSNIGFAFGPAIGGFVAASSFKVSLYVGAIVLGIVFLASILLLQETLPEKDLDSSRRHAISLGYGKILKDSSFLFFLCGDTLVKMGMVMMFNLLPVYSKENFGILESQYGFIMTINATMAATLQVPANMITRRYPPALALAVGAVFYAAGFGSVALGSQFIHFAGSMVIMTIGELILMPTAMTMVAAISPVEMRGRYMSMYSLTMGAAKGIGPVLGGIL